MCDKYGVICKKFTKPSQARLQDSVTGGEAEINLGGAREVYLCEFERGMGACEIYSSEDQTNKVKTNKKDLQFKKFHKSGYCLKILAFFLEILREDKKKGLRPKSFMKFGVTLQKLQKYGRYTPIWGS